MAKEYHPDPSTFIPSFGAFIPLLDSRLLLLGALFPQAFFLAHAVRARRPAVVCTRARRLIERLNTRPLLATVFCSRVGDG